MHKQMMHATKAVVNPDSNKDFRKRCRYLVYKSSNCEFSPAIEYIQSIIKMRFRVGDGDYCFEIIDAISINGFKMMK